MFIVYSHSRVTGIELYYAGYVLKRDDNQIHIEPKWITEKTWATRFATLALAEKIVNAFRFKDETGTIEYNTEKVD